MSHLFREAFNRGFSAGLAKQLHQEIKMSLISNVQEVKDCAHELVDYMENEENGVGDFVKLVNVGILNSPNDVFKDLRDCYVNLRKPYNPDAFRVACAMLYDCTRVVSDNLPIP